MISLALVWLLIGAVVVIANVMFYQHREGMTEAEKRDDDEENSREMAIW